MEDGWGEIGLEIFLTSATYPLLDGESLHVVLVVESCLCNLGPALLLDVIESSRMSVALDPP